MTRQLLRALGAIIVALVFMLTLAVNWPLAGLAGVLERSAANLTGLKLEGVSLDGVSGTLPNGSVSRIAFNADGWPLALGPLEWQLTWPLGIRLQLGRTPAAWEVSGEWRGRTSHWAITGGDMAALDLSQLPFSLDARWAGQLNLGLASGRCVASDGALTAARIELLSPTPISMGRGRLGLDCSTDMPRLLLDIDDGEALTLNIALATSGSGQVQGVITSSHPLSQWRQLLKLGAEGEQVDEQLRW